MVKVIENKNKEKLTDKKLIPIFSEKPIKEIMPVLSVHRPALVICDEYNYLKCKELEEEIGQNIVKVDYCTEKIIKDLRKKKEILNISNIIAIGGCTALDCGRACLERDENLIVIPSILSTACISLNRAIVYSGKNYKNYRVLETDFPKYVIFSFHLLRSSSEYDLKKWSNSGLADLLSRITAKLDREKPDVIKIFSNDIFKLLSNRENELLLLLEKIALNFKNWNDQELRMLAEQIHKEAFYERIDGGEHTLYHEMMKVYKYNRSCPTHGQIISIGVLLTSFILQNKFGIKNIYEKFKEAFRIIGLPTNYTDLENIGIKKEHILNGLNRMKKYCSGVIAFNGINCLDGCYGD